MQSQSREYTSEQGKWIFTGTARLVNRKKYIKKQRDDLIEYVEETKHEQ